MRWARSAFAALGLLAVAACGDEPAAEAPPPQELTRDAVGNYCGMIIVDHPGPKAQIFLAGRDDPIWFTSVREAMFFTRSPEEPKNIVAFYVNDMGRASWEAPEPGTWIDATAAWYVIGSRRRGGMGGPEAVPFSDKAAALAFIERYGGTLKRFGTIPDDYIFAVGEPMPMGGDDGGEQKDNTGKGTKP